MIYLSMRTVLFSHGISSAISTIVLILLWYQNRRRFSGTDFWVVNAVMQFVAILLIAMRGIIPDFITIVVGNTLILGGAFFIYIGLEKFVGKRTSQIHNYIFLTVFILIHSYFTFAQPSLLARNINISLGLLLIFIQSAWLLFRRVSTNLRPITVNIGIIAIGFCFLSIARTLVDLVIPVGNDFINSNSYDTLLVLSYQMLFVILTFGLILMVNRRLVEELEQDIIERKQAEETLRERETLYRQMFTNHTAVMLLIEPDSGQIVEANPAAATFYGYPVEVLQQMDIDQINISSLEKVAKDRQAAATGDQNYFVFSHRLASKEIREVEVHSVPIQIEGKSLLYSIVSDITERKLAEDALLESEEKFHTAFHASPVVMDISALEDGELLDANAQFFKLTGYERAEVIGRKATELRMWSNDTRQNIITEIKNFGYAHNKEVDLLTKSGDSIPILWFGDVVNIDNKPCLISSAYDLRKQKQTEEKIELQAKMLDTVNQAVIATDITGKVFYLNSFAETMYGWSEEEVLGKDFNEVTVPHIAAEQAQEIMEKLLQGESWEGEIQIQHKNGHVFPAFVSDTPIIDDTEKVIGVVGVSIDITERKRAKQALEESESKHRKMIANISDVVAVMDKNGIIQYKSPNIEKHFGWRPEDLVGTNGWDTVHPDDLDRIQKEFFALLKKPKSTNTVEYRYKRKDGGFSLIELTATNLTYDPQINGVLMNYHDITDRKSIENELKSQKSFFEQTFLQSATSTQILDKEGWCLRINPKLSELFGVHPEQMEGHVYNIFNDAEIKRNAIDKILKRVYKEQKVEKWEVHFDIGIAADSQNIEVEQKIKVWYANKAYPIVDSNGVVTNVIIQHEDITERKMAEQAVQDALQDKEVLLRELYHRTKNNMQVISSILNLEIDRIEDEISQKVLQDMDNRIRSMALVHQKLYQSQSLSSIDLRDYLSDLTNLIMANYQVTTEKVTISMEAEPIQVLIDTAIPCGLIVNEIVSNALKYAFPDTGKGEIKIRLLRSNKTDAAKINMEISDNGIGIPQEQNLRQSDTLGVQTIFGIAKHQLNAEVNLETNLGVSWQIQFEDNLYNSRV